MALIKQVLAEDDENAENYGVRRIYLASRNNHGRRESYSTICRICRENGLTLPKKKKPNSLTKEDKEAQKSENLINQDFRSDKPNEKRVSDITEAPCSDGKLYVAPVFNCFDGAIVEPAMDDNMGKELCIEAFKQACYRYKAVGMIFHTVNTESLPNGNG